MWIRIFGHLESQVAMDKFRFGNAFSKMRRIIVLDIDFAAVVAQLSRRLS